MQNVTSRTFFATLNQYYEIGGTVTNYTPIAGTKSVSFAFHGAYEIVDQNPFSEFKLQICEGTNSSSWNDVNDSHVTIRGGVYGRGIVSLVWTIDFGVGSVNDYDKGTIAAARPVFNMRWIGRHIGGRIYMNSPYSGTSTFSCPHISVSGIGESQILKYKRSV